MLIILSIFLKCVAIALLLAAIIWIIYHVIVDDRRQTLATQKQIEKQRRMRLHKQCFYNFTQVTFNKDLM